MKIPPLPTLVLGALLSATSLFAHDHEELSFAAQPVVRKFDNKTTSTASSVTVTWTYLGQEGAWPNVSDRYQCVINQGADPTTMKGYSLYNLQIQGRRWETQVHVVSGNQVAFTGGTSAPIGNGTWADGRPYKRVPMVARGAWNPNAPDSLADDRVGFIKFTGTECVLEIVSKRRRHSQMLPFQPGMVILSSHDATPPPGDGGGEN